MRNVTAVVSMLHEAGGASNSATRQFRHAPVLWWTLERLKRCTMVVNRAVLCWEDQLGEVEALAGEQGAFVLAKGPRVVIAEVEAVAAARRWADGWRGGLLGTCWFDRGFHAGWYAELCDRLEASGVVLTDPASGLIDPVLVDGLVAYAVEHPELEMVFSQAAPGLSGVVLRRGLLDHLAPGRTHPGRLLNYLPDYPSRDPVGEACCVPVPVAVARTTDHFLLDSERQVRRLESATEHLNGELMETEAEGVVGCMRGSGFGVQGSGGVGGQGDKEAGGQGDSHQTFNLQRPTCNVQRVSAVDAMPREVVLELNVVRRSCPVYWPGRYLGVQRGSSTRGETGGELSLEVVERLLEEVGRLDDIRLTLGGVGDPGLARCFEAVVECARAAGVRAIHVETDLLGVNELRVRRLAGLGIDVISVHVPAVSSGMYRAIMGVDGLEEVIGNVRMLLEERQRRRRGVPLVVPVFTKCRENLGEMEAWYDQWLRAVGSAVIVGPSDYGGQIPDLGVDGMSSGGRVWERMVVLCDGGVVACEEDVLGRAALGRIGEEPVGELWGKRGEVGTPTAVPRALGEVGSGPVMGWD
jgi:hypothetical protein